ncbi:MAG: serine/threonine protein kinase, partial [Candidatus Eremiobacteraeota bacterium]|nr:serine/threonine protein kinase [Candidatus Eremiobacteraeota bacterium]
MKTTLRRALIFCVWIWLLALPALGEVKRVTFRCQPPDAEAFLEVGTAKPFPLGNCADKINLDLSLFDGRRDIRLVFRREGFLPETRAIQNAPVRFRYFDSYDVYPPETEGPVSLSPAKDSKSRLIQWRLWLAQNSFFVTAFLLLLAGSGGYGAYRFRTLKRGAARSELLENLTAGLDDTDPFAGKLLGGYRVLEQLGRGGMSLVYRGVPDATLDDKREVAIKILDPQLVVSEDSIKRFRREIAICSELVHPNILPIYDYGEQESIFYLVMELLKGETLGDKADGKPQPFNLIAQWVAPIVSGVAYLHQRGIVHRDLKPDNVFLTEAGKILLMDFGIARGEKYTVATATHQGLGTPAYMSPEQVEGGYEEASDQYSLGCIVYEWLVGQPPFVDPDPFALAFKHVGQMPRSMRSKRPEISEELDLVVLRMLKKSPGER